MNSACEQRALDDLRQVHEREHRPVEIREVPREQLPLLGGELLDARDERHAPLRYDITVGAGWCPAVDADPVLSTGDGDHRRGCDQRHGAEADSRPAGAARAARGPSRRVSASDATVATWRRRSITCFTLRTKSPPDMTGAAFLPLRPGPAPGGAGPGAGRDPSPIRRRATRTRSRRPASPAGAHSSPLRREPRRAARSLPVTPGHLTFGGGRGASSRSAPGLVAQARSDRAARPRGLKTVEQWPDSRASATSRSASW